MKTSKESIIKWAVNVIISALTSLATVLGVSSCTFYSPLNAPEHKNIENVANPD